MKTTGNTLSFWRVEVGENGEDDAILALLGSHDRFDKIDIVFVEDADLTNVNLAPTPGNTIFADLRKLHVDAADLDQSTFLHAATALGAEIFGDNIKRVTRSDFKSRIQTALDRGRVSWESIPEAMRQDLKKP